MRLTMVEKMVSILSSCGRLKPVILQARLLFTRTLWAARLLCVYPISARYFMPEAIPCNMQMSWVAVNCPSCFCKTEEEKAEVRNVQLKGAFLRPAEPERVADSRS